MPHPKKEKKYTLKRNISKIKHTNRIFVNTI